MAPGTFCMKTVQFLEYLESWQSEALPLVCVCEEVVRDVVDFELVMGGPNSSSQKLHDIVVLRGEGLKAVVLWSACVGFACFLPERGMWNGDSSERGQQPD